MAPDWPGQGVDKYINAADEWVVAEGEEADVGRNAAWGGALR